jgi:guanylate cyclase
MTSVTHITNDFCNIHLGIYNKGYVRFKEFGVPGKKGMPEEMKRGLKILSEIKHKNINPFIGAYLKTNNTLRVVTDYCHRGSLQDILTNKEANPLDVIWLTSLISDLVQGMYFLHYSTQIGVHGNLRSSNCLLTSR